VSGGKRSTCIGVSSGCCPAFDSRGAVRQKYAPQGIQGNTGAAGPAGAPGPQGIQGDTGPAGVSAINIIPFASGTNANTVSTNSSGATSRVVTIGYGNSHSITTSSPTQFTLNAANNWYSFTMPRSGTIDSIYGNVATIATWTPTGTVRPYFAVAVATAGSNYFTIAPSSVTLVFQAYIEGTSYPAYTTRITSATGLGINVGAGSRIMIVGGIQTSGGTLTQTLSFSYTGGVGIQ
jgi:hypothetical protein